MGVAGESESEMKRMRWGLQIKERPVARIRLDETMASADGGASTGVARSGREARVLAYWAVLDILIKLKQAGALQLDFWAAYSSGPLA